MSAASGDTEARWSLRFARSECNWPGASASWASGQHRITDAPNRYEVDVDWSPDGKRLVFAATRVPGRYDVFTIKANGTKTRRLTRKGIGSHKQEITPCAGAPEWQPR